MMSQEQLWKRKNGGTPVATYTPGVRQWPLSKELYCQPLLRNNSVNNVCCYAVAATIMLATMEEQDLCFLHGVSDATLIFFCNSILFSVCTSTFSKLCKQCIQCHVEECWVALLHNQ
jgi:hypothetical protein